MRIHISPSRQPLILPIGLRNDNEPETFHLKHKTNAVVFPCQYIKIVPLMAWGANFNFSIWHVQVKGVPDPEIVQDTYSQYINVGGPYLTQWIQKHEHGERIAK